MVCKFCGNEMGPEEKICSACGQKVTSGGSGWKLAFMILCSVVLVAVLVVAILFGTGVIGADKVDEPAGEPTNGETVNAGTDATTDAPTDAVTFTSYTVDDDTAAAKANDVVATVGKTQLTNSELQIHYWAQVSGFLNNYGYYLSIFGLDPAKGLDEQASFDDGTKSWQQYFLDQAIQSWQSYAVLCEMADAEGFELDATGQEYLNNLESKIQSDATSNGFASVEEFLEAQAGPGVTKEGYISYLTVMYKSMQYFNQKYTEMTPTADEIAAYFEENAASYEEQKVTKDSGKVSNVRHILIKVEGGTTDESGKTVYSDEEWANCLAEAERVYQLWKDGEATEESFVAMVQEHTDDAGSATTGGLYEGVSIGSGYVEPFENWAADNARQPGDTGLVKVEASNYAGYHFMYYVSGEDVWYTTASKDLMSERFAEFFNGGVEAHPMESDYSKIGLGFIALVNEE